MPAKAFSSWQGSGKAGSGEQFASCAERATSHCPITLSATLLPPAPQALLPFSKECSFPNCSYSFFY